MAEDSRPRHGRARASRQWRLALAGVLGGWLTAATGAFAAGDDCDSSFAPADHPQAYRSLPGSEAPRAVPRCEGVYLARVSNLNLELLSFTGPQEDRAKTGDQTSVRLTWPPTTGEIVLRAKARTRQHDYYRMDARARGPGFTWPTDMLANAGVELDDVNVVGRINESDEACPHMVPIRFGTEETPATTLGPYDAVFAAAGPIASVTAAMQRLVTAAAESPEKLVTLAVDPPTTIGEPFKVSIPPQLEAGTYEVVLKALFLAGFGDEVLCFRFGHAGD